MRFGMLTTNPIIDCALLAWFLAVRRKGPESLWVNRVAAREKTESQENTAEEESNGSDDH